MQPHFSTANPLPPIIPATTLFYSSPYHSHNARQQIIFSIYNKVQNRKHNIYKYNIYKHNI